MSTPRERQLATSAGKARPLATQSRLWLDTQRRREAGADAAVYHSALLLRIEGRLEREPLAAALAALVDRHEALRTTFRFPGDELVAVVATEAPVPLTVAAVHPEEVDAALRAFFREPLSLERGPLLRARVFELPDGVSLLMLVVHHIAVDGWSLELLHRDVSELYAAARERRPPDLPRSLVQLSDLAARERELEESGRLEKDLAQWVSHLADAPPFIELPLNRTRPPLRDFVGDRVELVLPLPLVRLVREVARAEESTPFVVLLAAFQVALARWCAQDELVLTVAAANRVEPGAEDVVGPLVNLVPLRLSLDERHSFHDLLSATREELLTALSLQHVPFARLVERVAPERPAGMAPLVQVVVNDLGTPAAERRLGERLPFVYEGATHFDLVLETEARGGEIRLVFSFATDVFDRASIEALAERVEALLGAVCAMPHAPLLAAPTVTTRELAAIVRRGRGPDAAPAADVVSRILAAARARPERVAVLDGRSELSYGELVHRASLLAGELRARGVGPGSSVGVHLPRSAKLAAALLAVLGTGATYVPLDPMYPPERLRFVADDAAVAMVITSTAHATAADWTEGLELLLLGSLEAAGGAPGAPGALEPADDEACAYIVYTSGTTGWPKGAEVTHGALARLVDWYMREFRLSYRDRVPQIAPIGFDASIMEVMPALAAGACLLVVPDDVRLDPAALASMLDRERATVAFLVTPTFWALADAGVGWPRQLTRVLVGGEDLVRVPEPPGRLANLYGPTECTVCSTFASGLTSGDAPHIGGPIPGVHVYVLDPWLRPVPLGTPGELCIGGSALARGYRGRTGLTAARFVPDPFAGDGSRMYRSGDRVRWGAHGLEYLGRADGQVKVRGVRAELSEIERAVAEVAGAASACAVVRRDGPGGERLVAYYVADAGGHPPAADELRARLRTRLPEAMVPAALVPLTALPLTANGKIDRTALPAPHDPASDTDAALDGPVEQLVGGVWTHVLGHAQVSASDDFFALGGHSLLAMSVVNRLNAAIGCRVPISLIFERPVLRDLAAEVERIIVKQIERSEVSV